jgi:hypothetical protein
MSPVLVKKFCSSWISLCAGLLILTALVTGLVVLGLLENHIWYIDLIILSSVAVISIWVIWIAMILKNIAAWWTDMYGRVDHAIVVLQETNHDIKQLKEQYQTK